MIVESVRRFQRAMADVLAPGTEIRKLLDQLAAIGTALPKIERRIRDLPKEAQDAFQNSGYPPCLRLSLDDVDDIVRAFKNEGENAARALIETRCREIIIDPEQRATMVKDWESNPLLASRIDILREALAACVAGSYRLAIPTFLAQLEGVVADSVSHTGQMNFGQFKTYLSTLGAEDMVLGPHLEIFVRDVVLAKFGHGVPLTSDLSRHAILHGGDTAYGTERNAIRIVTLFDYVQELARPE